MASNSKGSKLSKSLIEQFCIVTGASKETAKQNLDVCHGNIEMAINMFLEEQEGQSSSSHIRDPIPPQQEVLVDTPGFQGFTGRSKRAVHSVFDSFRDFQVETRRQEEMMTGPHASSKMKSLEDLFRPPLDLMFHGSFQNARDAGVIHQKWLMVNVQNVLEFSCQILNRDIWSNKAIRTVVKEHFIFWQIYLDSSEGQRYAAFYNVTDWPYVAVLDPRTGESLRVWNRIDVSSFCDTLLEFLCQQQSMKQPQKRAKLTTSPLAGEAAPSDTNVASPKLIPVPDVSPTEITEPLLLSPDCNVPVPLISKPASASIVSPPSSTVVSAKHCPGKEPTPKLATGSTTTVPAIHTPAESLVPDSDPMAILDANEDEQMAAAIKASLVDSVANGNSKTMKKNPLQKRMDSTSSEDDKITELDSSWEMYFGSGDECETKFLLRFPDGTREQFVVPASAQIKALTTYVASKGYPRDEYEMVINFPRRVLSDMDETTTVKDLGLYHQETVFVQLR